MNNEKIGKLICHLRKESNMTQIQLANKMNISDKTVSKWERGLGCPELSLLVELGEILNVDLEKLLSGELQNNDVLAGNMKHMSFYSCPTCGNIITAMEPTNISCCSKKMNVLKTQTAQENEKMHVEKIDHEFYITMDHPMRREHYIIFVALLTNDTLFLKKLYPEWELQVRFPMLGHGKLFWLCSQHGLFSMDI